ncbi:tryptophan-rich sensory protein [Rhodoplanes sp. TEM]|uniref:Tryptophan-rich sensory protein n=1 Tax=Rhodoplanes tepidamans TaxID=200616 RepID=A0ABT5J4N5_RHOTP|nr:MULTISPECIES: TspO/MBR family protein [Rhodoplanes]MDC7784600.1 tryptophan-rich sensory protein [Rhodoplanes tepidamans]MDC7982892.1 tryptophan-rich sensory protein [Rhodoplanes sp. TEM]MDQ0355828.1 tryptophan-rich sensory protein [Rhodoplanes tepidamans]
MTLRVDLKPEPHARGFLGPLLLAALFTAAVATIGGELTQLGAWYQALKKPWWQPPDYAFPIVWTSVFALSVIGMAFAWRDIACERRRAVAVALFVLVGGLNVLWSFLFFARQRPDWALYEVGVLWLAVFLLVVTPLKDSKLASLFFFPYLAWVTIASYLTWTVVQLNGPFG